MSDFTKELLEQTLSKSDDSKESCSGYDLGPMEPVTELIRPEEAWIVYSKVAEQVLVTRGGSALPMIDFDLPDGYLVGDMDPLFAFRCWLGETELNLQLRAYETAHGYRLLVESQGLQPDGSVFAMLARWFRCDPSYLKLCQKQDCYRARLTPKFGPGRLSKARACKYLGTIGDAGIDEYLAPLIQLHDERTGALLDSGELG